MSDILIDSLKAEKAWHIWSHSAGSAYRWKIFKRRLSKVVRTRVADNLGIELKQFSNVAREITPDDILEVGYIDE